jgi:glycosyltransferase involved in cell wall biosynthesis
MKHVLFVTNFPSPYKVDFYDELSKYMQLTVLYSDKIEDQTHRDKDWFTQSKTGFRAIQLKKQVASFLGENLCLDVIDWLKKPYDAIVICGYSSPTSMLSMAYLKMKKIPFYIQVDGGLVRADSKLKYLYKKLLVSSANYWISSGKNTTNYLAHYGADRERTFEYPFTSLWEKDLLDKCPGSEEKIRLRQKLGMTEEKIILYVGRYDPKKGMDDLLHGVPSLDNKAGVYFVGGEPREEHLSWCRENNVENAHFVGFTKKEALSDYYKAADVLVLPTKSDVWGLVINEAMSFGLPVITTDQCVAGMELIENGINGYIIPVDDDQALVEKTNLLLQQDYRAMGAAALETIRPYTIENMAKVHVDIFNQQEK